MTISAVDEAGKFESPQAVTAENALTPAFTTGVPAVRRFQPNTIIAYSFTVYNAKIDKTNNQPNLTYQLNLYRDGQLFSEGKPTPLKLEKEITNSRLDDFGYLRLNPNASPGDYALQLIIKDTLKNQITAQWIDFEVIK